MSELFDVHPLVITGIAFVAVAGILALLLRYRRQSTVSKTKGLFSRSVAVFVLVLGVLLIVLGTWESKRVPDLLPSTPLSQVNPEAPSGSPNSARQDSCRVTIHVPPMMSNARVLLDDKPLPILERLHSAIIVKAALGIEKQKMIVVGEYRQCITFITISGDMDIEACM
ncbi:MAG: hypothetical protein ACKVRP_12105 [Bacteroidota bacterium]